MTFDRRHFRVLAASIVAPLLMVACASPEEIKAADKRTCAGYGFAEGSDAFANCMMQADQHRADQQAAQLRDQQMRMEMQMERARLNPHQTEQVNSTNSGWTHENCHSSGTSVTIGGVTSGSSSTHCSGR
ncbi:hypothetical protein [Acidovorax cavernicola]|uniref:DUF2799 domain-containing protein n=1 Tax=Acidovorax cavernicola TaxID=1675792 RepID=A0A9X8D4X7_9BURK|nr:hypothetical protein [Acidovorax cavernicola]RIX79064.1 hypothetical protein D3H34_15085 [Acidovorax cavernicola]